MKSNRCPKCGTGTVLAEAQIQDHTDHHVKIRVHAQPDAKLFKKGTDGRLQAWVCGACGFTELYVQDPKEFLKKHRAKKEG